MECHLQPLLVISDSRQVVSCFYKFFCYALISFLLCKVFIFFVFRSMFWAWISMCVCS